MSITFSASIFGSLGVELELQVIDPITLDLKSDAQILLEEIKKTKIPCKIKSETTQSTIEICSNVHKSYDSLIFELKDIKDKLNAICKNKEVEICGGGTHPFQHWSDRKVSPEKRYKALEELYGYLIKHATTFGQHIHLGCRSGDEAIYLIHAFSRYVPHLIALSASSPFYQGFDTEFDSSRLHFSDPLPTTGTIPFFKSWQDFEHYFLKMEKMGIAKTMKDIHWDIRPKPEFGTIEIRVCDAPLDIYTAAALAAFTQTLGHYLIEQDIKKYSQDLYIVYQFNRFQAAHYGLFAECLDYRMDKKYNLKEEILKTFEKISPLAKSLGTEKAILYLTKRVNKGENDARLLRDEYYKNSSLEDMVRLQLARWQR